MHPSSSCFCRAAGNRDYMSNYENLTTFLWNVSFRTEKSSFRTEKSSFRTEKSSFRAEKSSFRTEKSSFRTEKSSFRTEKSSFRTEKSSFRTLAAGALAIALLHFLDCLDLDLQVLQLPFLDFAGAQPVTHLPLWATCLTWLVVQDPQFYFAAFWRPQCFAKSAAQVQPMPSRLHVEGPLCARHASQPKPGDINPQAFFPSKPKASLRWPLRGCKVFAPQELDRSQAVKSTCQPLVKCEGDELQCPSVVKQ